MYFPAIAPLPIVRLPTLRTWLRQCFAWLTPTPAQQILLSAADTYHLEAGSYRLRVLAGRLWLPEIGIYNVGEQVELTVDTAGLTIHSYAQQPAVLALRLHE